MWREEEQERRWESFLAIPPTSSSTVLPTYTNFSAHNHLKTPYFQCRWPKSNPHPSLPPHCINHPSIPNSSCLLAFSLYLLLCLSHSPLSLSPLSPSHTRTHAQTHSFSPTLTPSVSLLAGSLKTSLSREEGKVLFCLISLLSPVWRKHS